MKIAYVCADRGIPVFGHKGCSLHVQEMAHAFRTLNAEVTLFAGRVGGNPPAALASLAVVELPSLGDAEGAARERAALSANQPIANTVRAGGPFDIVYERYALWSHAALEAARTSGATTVLEVNAPLIEEQERFRSLHDRDAALAASRRAFAAADIIVAVSEEVGDYLGGFPQARHKVQVIPNGVNAQRFSDGTARRLRKPEGFTIGFVGTLKPWHGVDILLRTFARLEAQIVGSRLLIVGDGPQRDALTRLATQLGVIDKVTFTGSVAPDAVPGLLADMDVGVAPYPALTDFYFSPLKVYEYMASGLPVVASRIGQLNRIIDEQIDGLLCAPGDVDDLCAALLRIHEDPAAAQSMGQQGQQKVRAHHTWQSVAERVLDLAAAERNRSLPQERAS